MTAESPARDASTKHDRTRDLMAMTALLAASVIVALNRADFDFWLSRYDVYTQFLPWYHFLGEHIRQGDIPGWNPHLFSGTPFAGHPLSGWMYLPAMVSFALFQVLTGFKVMVGIQLVIASLSTYVYGRVLGMEWIGSLVAAIVFTFGPFLEWNTYTSLQFSQYATWIPLALIGIELSLRAPRWQERLAPWCLSGFALSQMLGGWVGEGWIYTGLIIGGYVAYRALISPPRPLHGVGNRLKLCVLSGIAIFGSGTALAAAGMLPRLTTNMQTALAGADYSELGPAGILNVPWNLSYLFTQLLGMGTAYHFRAVGLGGAVVVLMLLAPMIAWRRAAVPFFVGLTLVSLILTQGDTPLHQLFYLIPQYEDLHIHDPWRVVALALPIGPAMLSGAAVDALHRRREELRLLPLIPLPFVVVLAIAISIEGPETESAWIPIIPAFIVTLIALVIVAMSPHAGPHLSVRRVPQALLALMAAIIFLQPTGLELTQSWLGWPNDVRWEGRLNPDSSVERATRTEVSETDPGGAGEFLQQEMENSGPFRYLGYGGAGHPEGPAGSYMNNRFGPFTQAILVNGRPIFLGLYEIQGYDPIQLERYVDFMTAVNGAPQDYHTAFVLHHGVRSPLLDLLDVQYVLVSRAIPPDRQDVVRVTEGFEEVFRNDRVIVYENQNDLPHAWIVHEVQRVEEGEALPLIRNGEVDPYQVALVEGDAPGVAPANDPGADSAEVVYYEADTVRIETSTDAPGFLVMSDTYAKGWHAWVNGEEIEIQPTHHALRGIPIPAGESTVELRYEPLSLRAGVAITALSGIVMLGIVGVRGWQRVAHRLGRHTVM